MNLPNKLTIARIALTFIFMFFLFSKGLFFKISALITFAVASWTDFLDGFFAKRKNQVSNFGKFMDPVADKVLVIAAFLSFVEMKLIPAWIVLIIVFREFIITGFRLLALAKGEVIEAEKGGKHKTVSQMVSIYVILFFIIFREAGLALAFLNEKTIFYMMLITAIFTVVSGVLYLVRNKRFL